MKKLETLQEQKINFWDKVDIRSKDECWPWQAALCRGYGVFGFRGKNAFKAHRAAWIFTYGEIDEGLLVRHYKCGNRACCNPRHLRLGTAKDNQADTLRMGRVSCGEGHPVAKLRSYDVTAIRHAFLSGKWSVARLAGLFHVHSNAIYDVLSGHSWDTQDAGLLQALSIVPARYADSKGENNANCRLCRSDVVSIRHMLRAGKCMLGIARKYRVSVSTIAAIKQGRVWKDV